MGTCRGSHPPLPTGFGKDSTFTGDTGGQWCESKLLEELLELLLGELLRTDGAGLGTGSTPVVLKPASASIHLLCSFYIIHNPETAEKQQQ